MGEGPDGPAGAARPADAAGLAAQVRRMEIAVAAMVTRGEAVPPEAERMLARLREVAVALEGLTASLAKGAGEE
jgi:hypothetical protein